MAPLILPSSRIHLVLHDIEVHPNNLLTPLIISEAHLIVKLTCFANSISSMIHPNSMLRIRPSPCYMSTNRCTKPLALLVASLHSTPVHPIPIIGEATRVSHVYQGPRHAPLPSHHGLRRMRGHSISPLRIAPHNSCLPLLRVPLHCKTRSANSCGHKKY